MKKGILLLTLLLTLSGCGLANSKQTVTLYYPRAEYDYRSADGVIGQETRDITGHGSELRYLLDIYLMGPSNEKLRSPFPAQAKLESVEQGEDGVVITLSDVTGLSDSRFTLGCYCLSLVCRQMDIQGDVTVTCGNRSMTLGPEDITTQDYGFTNDIGDNGGKK